jgi:hypothetical protein
MLKTIPLKRVIEICDKSSFPYRIYKQWANEEMAREPLFFTFGSCTADIRPREEWNTLGRELYDVTQVERHARIVGYILQHLGLKDSLVQQTVPEALWFHGNTNINTKRIGDILAYLERRAVKVNFSKWHGAFHVEEEISDFLTYFLDYPYLFKNYDIEIISTDAPLALVVNHHLCIEYISPNEALINDLRARIVAEGILEFPERGLIGKMTNPGGTNRTNPGTNPGTQY